MSFFAVLDAENDEARNNFVVEQLHVNLWSVVGLLPRRRALLVDVGVRITAKNPTRTLSLAIPFRVLSQRDLSSDLRDPESAALIFDSVVRHDPTAGSIHVDEEELLLIEMNANSALERTLSSDAISVWNVNFVRALQAGETGYFRMRFEVAGGRAWQWQKQGLFGGRAGLLLDLRVADIRSTIALQGGPDIRERVVDVEKAYLFAVLPEWLTPSTESPPVGYIRLLEPRVWGKYLGRKAEFWGRRLVVYQWKSDRTPDGDPIPVTSDHPLRLYGRFDIRMRFAWQKVVLGSIVGSIIVVALLFDVPAKPEVLDFLAAAWDVITQIWVAVLLPLGIVGLIASGISWIKGLWKVRGLLRKFESLVFSKFFRPEE